MVKGVKVKGLSPSHVKTASPVAAMKPGKDRRRFGQLRLLLLFGAFLLILINPFLNYYLHQNFIQGWYQSLGVGNLWFVSPLEGVESVLTGKAVYIPALVGMVVPVTLALLLGRVFCSWLCPVSFFLEIFDRLRKKITQKKFLENKLLVVKKVLWFVLMAEFLLSMIIGAPLFVFLSPPGLVGREIMMFVFFGSFAMEGLLLGLIVVLELLTRRFFCRSFCPLGGFLALLGQRRKLRVHREPDGCSDCGKCNRTCPMGLRVREGESSGVYCWNCGECVDICSTGALRFQWKNWS